MLLFLILLAFFGFSSASVVARVGSEVIKRDELYEYFNSYWREILHLPIARATKEDVQNFLVELVRSKVIRQEAKKMGISLRDAEVEDYIQRNIGSKKLSPIALYFIETEILVDKIAERLYRGSEITENQVVAYYYLNLRDFKMPAQVRLERFVADNLESANELYYRLSRGIVLWDDIKGVKKGEAVWYSMQALPDVLKAQLRPYEVGRVSKPIYTEAGYVVFRVVGRRKEGILSLEEAKPMVRAKLIREKRQEVLKEWLEKTLRNYRVEFYFSQF
jgi:parvulin-like peptidyl-prolyl isomerase